MIEYTYDETRRKKMVKSTWVNVLATIMWQCGVTESLSDLVDLAGPGGMVGWWVW